jgi:hypothetical protein
MKKLYFDFRDVFRTPRLALSAKKIWVHFLGLLVGWGIYVVLSYIALLANGQSLVEIWNTHHFFPTLFNLGLPIVWYSWLIYIVGIALWVIIFLLASLAVSRLTYKQIKGDEFFSSGDSFKYVKKHGTAAIMAPVSIILIIAFFIVLAIIAAWLSKWPVLDIIFLGLPYLLYFAVAVFVVYTAIVFVVSFILSPSIVGTAEEDTMETVFQSYSTLWAQPWRLVVYEVIVIPLTALATFIYGYAVIFGYRFFDFVFGRSWLMGDKLGRIMDSASSYILGAHSPITLFLSKIFNIYSPAALGITMEPLSLTTTETIATVLITIALFVIFGTVVSFLLTNFSVGQSLIYIILRKKKDDENLIERKDEDELAEEEEVEKEKEEEEQTESAEESPEEKKEE